MALAFSRCSVLRPRAFPALALCLCTAACSSSGVMQTSGARQAADEEASVLDTCKPIPGGYKCADGTYRTGGISTEGTGISMAGSGISTARTGISTAGSGINAAAAGISTAGTGINSAGTAIVGRGYGSAGGYSGQGTYAGQTSYQAPGGVVAPSGYMAQSGYSGAGGYGIATGSVNTGGPAIATATAPKLVTSTAGQSASTEDRNGIPSVRLSQVPNTGLYPGDSEAPTGSPRTLQVQTALPSSGSGVAHTTPSSTPGQLAPKTKQAATIASVQQAAMNAGQHDVIPKCGSAGVVCMSPALPISPKNTNDCVYFLTRDIGVKLPPNLYTMPEKVASINVTLSDTPKRGDVAVISVTNPKDAPYGHVALVTDVTPQSITILEANYQGEGIVDTRISRAPNLRQAENQLHIVGFIR